MYIYYMYMSSSHSHFEPLQCETLDLLEKK